MLEGFLTKARCFSQKDLEGSFGLAQSSIRRQAIHSDLISETEVAAFNGFFPLGTNGAQLLSCPPDSSAHALDPCGKSLFPSASPLHLLALSDYFYRLLVTGD